MATIAVRRRAGEGAALNPIDRVVMARDLAALIPSTPSADVSRLFDQLADLSQEGRPTLADDGSTIRVAVYPEIVGILLEAVEREGLVESSLLSPRYRLCGEQNQVARREISQRTAAVLPEALRTFRREASTKSFILGIVDNQYKSWVRETARDRAITDLPEDDVLAGATLRSSLLLNRLEISDVMADLAPKHRILIDLVFFQGLSAADIRERLELTDGQYRNRRRQALKEMSELLEERGHGR